MPQICIGFKFQNPLPRWFATWLLLHHLWSVKLWWNLATTSIASSLFNESFSGSRGDTFFVNFIPLNLISKMKFHFMKAIIISHYHLHNGHLHHDDKCGLPEKPPERREVDMKTRTREPVLPCATLKIFKYWKCATLKILKYWKCATLKIMKIKNWFSVNFEIWNHEEKPHTCKKVLIIR